jgi:cytochrome b involved in lipid metabolism
MNKKTTAIIITLPAIVLIFFLMFNKKPEVVTPVEEVSPRNDTVSEEKAATTENTVKSYSLAEVALHDKREDCWLVIEGNVINPTQFITEGKHPNDFILKGCGLDATEIFKKIPKHAGPRPQDALIQYKIGVLK